ncbi:DUF1573 domain-containing protein [Reichenbachiella agarivorans]|uniref:DUF1573 domain-containing protein n=1 Tax=Reichenbachiella agarivorans TaxID=2979464 RepID=A0ABY6CLI4_9BACT|nr:DUF1573 domain-containing protein [Reichenbachiella agarivorans]UXP31386.1 DUF1573 domain-containing protein [Reichenbachiella agarivorans]
MNKIILSTFLFTWVFYGQMYGQAKIELEKETHDFGSIQEEDGAVLYEFQFTNVGDAPLLVSTVKASCGCTTPDWTKQPVLPGEKGYVRAQYNPMNRPGTFNKSLRITTNGSPQVAYAYIKGTVVPKVKTIEEELVYKMGDLRVKSQNVNLGRITDEKTITTALDIYNAGEDTLRILDQYDGPKFISLTFESKVLAPKEKSIVTLVYDPSFKDHLGMQNHGISFYTDEKEDAQKSLNVRATIREYFAPMTDADRAKAPVLMIGDKLQNVGRVDMGKVVSADYVLYNHGKSTLNIRKIESNCACLTTQLDDYDIKPGKSVNLKLSLDTTNRRGTQNKTVYIYTNDPENPTQVVTIRAIAEKNN